MKVLKKALLLLIIASNISGCAYVDNFKNNWGYIKEKFSNEDYSEYNYNNSAVAYKYDVDKVNIMPTYRIGDTCMGGAIANDKTSNTSNFVFELKEGVTVTKEDIGTYMRICAKEDFGMTEKLSEPEIEVIAGKVMGKCQAEKGGTVYKIKAMSKWGSTLVVFEELIGEENDELRIAVDDAFESLIYIGNSISQDNFAENSSMPENESY